MPGRAPYPCPVCGEPHRYPISAALCCDALSNDLPTDDDPTIVRGVD